jgi:hypothetical protein
LEPEDQASVSLAAHIPGTSGVNAAIRQPRTKGRSRANGTAGLFGPDNWEESFQETLVLPDLQVE